MKLLLDTHIWIWAVLDRDRLGRRVREALASLDNELWLSPVSIWELVLLIEKNRFRATSSARAWIAGARLELSWQDALFTPDVALEAANLTMPHRDPSDRLLLATARWYGLTLVTADERLLTCGQFASLMPNR